MLAECFPEKAQGRVAGGRRRRDQPRDARDRRVGIARRAARAPGARRRRGARADRPRDRAGDLRAVRRRRSSTPPGWRDGTAASRRPTSTPRARRSPPCSSSLPEARFRDGLPPAARDAVARVRDATRALLSVLKPESGPKAPARGRPQDGPGDHARAVRGGRPDGRRPRRQPAHRPVVRPQRGPSRQRAHPAVRRAARRQRPHPHPPAGGPLRRAHVGHARARRLVRPDRPRGRSRGPPRRRAGRARPRWRGAPAPPRPPGSRGAGSTSAARSTTRSRGSSTSRGTCRRPGREPATDAQLDEIAELVTAAGGRTLGLFSSRRAATAAAAAMRERLDVPILVQGDDQLPTLVSQFIADEPTCLFGTLSLWQGVDVPGATCRLVLIDRIPFPRPDDPVQLRALGRGRDGGRQRLPRRLRDARRPAARAGRRSPDPDQRGPWRRRGPRPAAGDRRLRRLPHAVAARLLADHRPRGGRRRAAAARHASGLASSRADDLEVRDDREPGHAKTSAWPPSGARAARRSWRSSARGPSDRPWRTPR